MKTVNLAIYYSNDSDDFEASYLHQVEVDPSDSLSTQISTIHTAVESLITNDKFRGYKIVSDILDLDYNRQFKFRLDDTSGDAVDAQNANDLAATGSPSYGKSGRINTSILFTAGTYFSATSTTEFVIQDAKEFLISLWYKVTAHTNVLLGKLDGGGGNSYYIFTVDDGSGNPKPKVYANGVTVDSGVSTTLDEWTHLLVAIDVINSKIRIYVNGTLAVTNSSAQALGGDTGRFYLGSDGLGNGMEGYLDQVEKWAFGSALDDHLRNQYATTLYNEGVGIDG